MTGCGGEHGRSLGEDTTLNLYAWAALIPEETISQFERETGIKVNYDTFETDEVLATKLLAGHTGYDVVYPGDVFFEQELHAGAFRKVEIDKIANVGNLDADLLKELAAHDPGNAHGLPYTWSTTGLGYNVEKVRDRLGSAQSDSWALLLDAENARKLQDCGIAILDSPWDVLPSVLLYLGKDPNSRNPADIEAALQALMRIRPYVRLITSIGNIDGLANGDRCLVLGYSGDMVLAGYRAREAGNGIKIQFIIPREGVVFGAVVMAVPTDAPHPEYAATWIDYTMRPEISARLTNTYKYSTGNTKSVALVEADLRDNPSVFPDASTRARLHVIVNVSPEQARIVTRYWTRFRTGR